MKRRLLAILAVVLLVPGTVVVVVWLNGGFSPASDPDAMWRVLRISHLPTEHEGVGDLPECIRQWEGRQVSLTGEVHVHGGDYWAKPQTFFLERYPPRRFSEWSPAECVRVRVLAGQAPSPWSMVTVEGTLHLAIERDLAGRLTSLYRVDTTRVIDSAAGPPPAAPRPDAPAWLWLLLACPVPLLVLHLRRQARALRRDDRRLAGLCVCCGYDLRASYGRCPECGTPVRGHAMP